MTSYINYQYYHDTFGGTLIPSDKFEKYSVRASNEVRIRIQNRDITGFETEVKNVTCSVAEAIYKQDQLKANYQTMITNGGGMITTEKVGDYSVSKITLSMKELQELCSKESLDQTINSEIESALLFTGLLFRGVSDIRDV